MSHLSLTCPVCRQQLSVPQRLAGTMILCPKCEFQWLARGPESSGAAAAAPLADAPDAGGTRERRPAAPKKRRSAAGSASVPAKTDTRIRAARPSRVRRRRDDRSDETSSAPAATPARPQTVVEPFDFNLRIASDSYELLKGKARGRVTRQGLLLRCGLEEELLPVGVVARYLGKNEFYVDMDTRRLHLRVPPWGCYARRLARELAGYLSGKKSWMRRSDYFVPWYLYVSALLPLGMPAVTLVGGAGADLSSRTLTGAVAGAAGGFLAAGCLLVVGEEEWPLPLKLLLTSIAIALGYGAVFLYALLYLWGVPPAPP